jgi:hypothetical protein
LHFMSAKDILGYINSSELVPLLFTTTGWLLTV